MFGASSTTEWHLNYDTTAQWYAPVNACQAAVIFTAGQLPYAKVTVCGGWVSVEATADVGNQPDAASLQAGLNVLFEQPHCLGEPEGGHGCGATGTSLRRAMDTRCSFGVGKSQEWILRLPRISSCRRRCVCPTCVKKTFTLILPNFRELSF